MLRRPIVSAAFLFLATTALLPPCAFADHNLSYLTDNDPWYPHAKFPKLITPQWVGEEGVDAVVVLAIDDMRDPEKYEAYLRPILQRLKQIDGRAPVSIMTCSVKPDDPRLQTWIDEGLSFEVHTIDHPCPLLAGERRGEGQVTTDSTVLVAQPSPLSKSKSTYDRCVDLLNRIPGNSPVAFRMPCCDSLNTVSPRFYSEIFNGTSPEGRHLAISSSVFNLFTKKDPTIYGGYVVDKDGTERFRQYIPKGLKRGGLDNSRFVNTIENYPYPFVINKLCWEFPCAVPSDWEAQFLQKPNNPKTVEDMKLALRLTVDKKGVFNLVFHPHGWIKSEQVVDIIDYAVSTYGKRVKFLTFREAYDRLNKNLLAGNPLRAEDGSDNGVRIVDVDRDGYMDVVIGNPETRKTRVWDPQKSKWNETGFSTDLTPTKVQAGQPFDPSRRRNQFLTTPAAGGVNFVMLRPGFGKATGSREVVAPLFNAERFQDGKWVADKPLQELFSTVLQVSHDHPDGRLVDVCFRQLNRHGSSVALATRGIFGDHEPGFSTSVWHWNAKPGEWVKLRAEIPAPVAKELGNSLGRGIRFADLDNSGDADILLSDGDTTRAWLMSWYATGKSRPLRLPKETPPLVRADGSDNGFFYRDGDLCWINESTDGLNDLTERIPIADSVATAERHKKLRDLQPALIGAAKMDITPATPIRMAGYGGRLKESEGVADRIFARALVIGGHQKFIKDEFAWEKTGDFMGSGQGSLLQPEMSIVVSIENCGVPDKLTNRLAEELAKRFGIRRQRIAVCSTHSHSAPWLRQFSPLHISQVTREENEHLAQYEIELLDKLVKVVTKAVETRRPGRLEWGTTNLDFAINRRRLDGGRWAGFGAVPDGPVDHRMPLLIARDLDGHLIGLLANYACHCTTLGGDFNQISGDWAGYASKYLEEELQDDDSTEPVALISIGCGADANPEPRGGIELCQRHGREFADRVLSLIGAGRTDAHVRQAPKDARGQALTDVGVRPTGPATSEMTPLDPRVVCRMTHVDLPLGPLPSTEEWEARAKEGGSRGQHAQYFLEMTRQEKPLPTSVRDYPVQTWLFGDELAMVFLGGEVVVDYAIRMSRDFDGDRLWFNGYSNAMPCYIASKRLLREGGYEVDSSMYYYAQPTRLAPEAEDIIVDTVQKLLPPRFYSEELKTDFPPPTDYRDAAETIHVPPGFKVELVAREPMVQDPVAFDWDEQGRLWVVQMGDYPGGPEANEDPLTLAAEPGKLRPEKGSICILTDEDGDGLYDRSVLFLANISHPTGIRCWQGGVIVTAAPEIFFAKDYNGNGQPDVRETLYKGFTEGNQQHRVNGLEWGLDNWLHVANGDSGGSIQPVISVPMAEALGKPPLNAGPTFKFHPDLASGKKRSISGRDLRILPNLGAVETEAGQSQFGRCRDDWGNWFGCNNSNPMWHYVLSERYVRRNPHVPVGDLRHHVFEIPGASPVYPRSRTLARFNDFSRTNRFTSACSTTIYRDTLLGEEFYGNSFTCEPVHNLISRRIVEPDGITFKAHRAESEKESEFLASTDNWFRPVYARTGPDGALWIADMYRFVIEHPKWIPAEHQRRLDLKAGDTMGRIWRIVPDTSAACCGDPDAPNPPATEVAKLKPRRELGPPAQKLFSAKWDEIPVEELVSALASPNGWKRDRAQQILINREEHKAAEALWKTATDAKEPLGRLHALCAASWLDGGNEKALLKLLADPHPGVRRHAVRLSEELLQQNRVKITAAVLERAADSDPQVRLQVAYSLGFSDSPAAGEALGRLAIQHEGDAQFLTAILSSVEKQSAASALRAVLEAKGENEKPSAQLVARFVGQVAAFGEIGAVSGELSRVFKSLGKNPSSERVRGLVAVMKEVRRSQKTWEQIWRDELAERCFRFGESRLEVARDSESSLADRMAALEFLAVTPAPPPQLATKLAELLSPATPSEVQVVVVEAIATAGREKTPELLLDGWKAHSPGTRSAITSKLLERAAWSKQLLLAIQAEAISPSEIGAAQRQVLLGSREAEIRQLAASVFQTSGDASRAAIIESFSPVRELKGDVARGTEVFKKRCGSCHQLGKIGKQLGADLDSLRDRSTASLLTAILDPNRAVEARFLNYVAVTDDGKSFSGMLRAESATSITLASADGKEVTLLRKDLDTLVGSAKSFMPEGLEKDLSHQDMADVISFVQSSGTPWKRFDGNQPMTILPAEDGSLTLPATAAAIYGPSLIFEAKYKNLGFWSSEKDYAVWTLELPSSGTYEVELDYACDNSTAGNPIRFSTGTRVLTANVPGTGTWDEYRKWKAGSIDLSRGSVQFVASAAKRPESHLIDLKSIRLRRLP
jgi:putative membrane-bound dehydrogenase-like protein